MNHDPEKLVTDAEVAAYRVDDAPATIDSTGELWHDHSRWRTPERRLGKRAGGSNEKVVPVFRRKESSGRGHGLGFRCPFGTSP